MSMLSPKLSILDETDSGLDIDALRIVADGVNTLRNEENSFLIITHYQTFYPEKKAMKFQEKFFLRKKIYLNLKQRKEHTRVYF